MVLKFLQLFQMETIKVILSRVKLNTSVMDISYDVLPGNYIEITEDEYSMCYQKRQDYTIIENKLTFSPPKQRTWGLVQKDLSRNPYICNK